MKHFHRLALGLAAAALAGATSVLLTHRESPEPTTSTSLLHPKAAATWRLSAVSGATCHPRGSSIQRLWCTPVAENTGTSARVEYVWPSRPTTVLVRKLLKGIHGMGEYDPAAHSDVGADNPVALQYMPAGQGTHEEEFAPITENDPGWQSPEGSQRPVTLQCLPAGHGCGPALLPWHTLPAGHAAQSPRESPPETR